MPLRPRGLADLLQAPHKMRDAAALQLLNTCICTSGTLHRIGNVSQAGPACGAVGLSLRHAECSQYCRGWFQASSFAQHHHGTDSPIWDLYPYGPDLNKHQVLTSCLGPMIRECGM